MFQQITSRPYENSKGEWDIEIEYDENPKGDEDYGTGIENWDTRVVFCMIKGPNDRSFTYKIRFAASVVATEKLHLGSIAERIASALTKAQGLIDEERYSDSIVTRRDNEWIVSDAPKPLKKHS